MSISLPPSPLKLLHFLIFGLSSDPVPVIVDDGNRTCVAWDKFEGWMAKRSFDPFEPGILVHPIYG